MRVGDIFVRRPETATRLDTIRRAAEQMAYEDVGTIVVADSEGMPEGILTDRDIVIRCVAKGLPPEETTVAEAMSDKVRTVLEDTRVEVALESMADEEIRRMVVVDEDGRVEGIVSLDDVLSAIVEQTEDVGRLLRRQVHV